MASNFNKIKLMIKDGSKYTTKQFTSAEFSHGYGTDLQIRLEEATKQMIWKQFVLFKRML